MHPLFSLRLPIIPAFLVVGIVLIGNLTASGQSQDENTYDWLSSSPDGNWTGSGNRWQAPGGGSLGGPTANRILRLNNNHYTTMNNNVSSGFQIYQLQFASGSSSNRTINGNSVVFNPESNLGNTVKVENFSTATHTINLAISRGSGSGDLQLNPVNGGLIFGSTIDNGGKTINIWGDSKNSLELNNIISGSGEFNIRRSTIVKFNAANTYTGSTVVSQGELWIMTNGSISSSSAIWLGNNCQTCETKLFLADGDGGQTFNNQINFNYGDEGKQFLGGLNNSGTNTFSGNNISISSGKTLTIEEVHSGGTLEFSNGISGAGSIKLVGSGTTVFTGANTYTGETIVNGGILRLYRTGGTTLPITNNVTVSSGTLKVSTNQELNNLSVTSGSLVVDAGVTLTISGTFTGGGTITNNGTIVIKGSSNFPGANTIINTMNNLTIDRAGGITLNKDLEVAGTLTLSSGVLDAGTVSLTALGSIAGASSTTYIKTSSTGVLKILLSNGTSKTFPVGNSSYNPVTITNNTGASDNFTVRVSDAVLDGGTTGNAITDKVVKRTWHIEKTTANVSSGIDMTFSWDVSEEGTNMTDYKLSHYGSAWAPTAGTSSNVTVNGTTKTMTNTGYTGTFSPFAIGSSTSVLPVTWHSFTAVQQGNGALLRWSTAIEQNTKDFVVEYSTNAISWSPIGTVAASGNSSILQYYSYLHKDPLKGQQVHFYRILQRDLDGRFSYSKIARLQMSGTETGMLVYPNPARDVINVYLSQPQELHIISITGAEVWRNKLPAGNHQIEVGHLLRGMYIVATPAQQQKIALD